MSDPVAYPDASDRWLGEFLTSARATYLASPTYRQKLHRERAPLFAPPPHRAA